MELRLSGKKALVTGASYGLGYASAETLASEGVDLVICSRDEQRITKAAESMATQYSVKVQGVSADLTDAGDLKRLSDTAEDVLDHVDILVLSTGHPPTYPFSAATDAQWQLGHDLILQPAISLCKRFLDGMKTRGYGRIIFIGSIFGLEAEVSSVIQSTYRAGLNGLMKCISLENAAYGVTANVICPGYFDTPLVRNLAGQYADQEKKTVDEVLDDWRTFSPTNSFGKPEDLGALVSFLASPRAEFLSGTCITFDGGAVKQV